jgi:single-strand DNA-binding protein
MIQASLSGRLGKDSQEIATTTGKPMTKASLAVDVSPHNGTATVWVYLIAFGRLAEELALHVKGDIVAATGRLELSQWTAADGTERESWQLVAEALHSARLARGDAKRGRSTLAAGGGARSGKSSPSADDSEPLPFNDPLGF